MGLDSLEAIGIARARELADATNAILKTQEIKDRFAAISPTPVGNTPAEFTKYVKEEVDK